MEKNIAARIPQICIKSYIDTGWNKQKAAGRRGINRTTLRRKLEKYRLETTLKATMKMPP